MRILINESQLGVIKEAFSVGLINIITEKFRHTNPEVDEDKIREYIKRFDEIKGSPNVKEKDITKFFNTQKDSAAIADTYIPRSN